MSRPLYLRGMAVGTNRLGRGEGARAKLDTQVKRQIFCLFWQSSQISSVLQSAAKSPHQNQIIRFLIIGKDSNVSFPKIAIISPH